MLAVINGRDAIVGVLADAGADLTIGGTGAPGFAGKTALDLAAGANRVIAMALLKDAENTYKRAPLSKGACRYVQPRRVRGYQS